MFEERGFVAVLFHNYLFRNRFHSIVEVLYLKSRLRACKRLSVIVEPERRLRLFLYVRVELELRTLSLVRVLLVLLFRVLAS